MRYFRNILFALAAFVWLPASAHCQLEKIPGLEFLQCAAGDQNSQDPCHSAGCCSVEKSQYTSEQDHFSAPFPAVQPALQSALVDSANSLPVEVTGGILIAAPPSPFAKIWQFSSRTALPVRAPSIAS